MPTPKSTIAKKRVAQFQEQSTALGEDVKGASMPYLSMNGNMFAFLSSDGALHLRMSENDRDEAIRRHAASQSIQHGSVLKEYVMLPEVIWNKPKTIASLLSKSRDYAATLKPKPTKKK